MVIVLLFAIFSCCFCGCFGCGRMLNDPPTEQRVEQSDCIRGLSFGVSLFTAPALITLQDLGCCRQRRMPHEIYSGVQTREREMTGTTLPQFSTMEIEANDDIESQTNSATEHDQ
jgi:hypothetical protein